MRKEYCYVLDFSEPGIYEISLQVEDQDLDTETLLNKYGFEEGKCFIMFTDHQLLLNYISK